MQLPVRLRWDPRSPAREQADPTDRQHRRLGYDRAFENQVVNRGIPVGRENRIKGEVAGNGFLVRSVRAIGMDG